MIPQIIFLSLVLIGLMLNSFMHGKDKTGKYNVFYHLIANLITLSLLYYGGFFNVFFK